MPRFDVSIDYLVSFLQDLINTPSPTGDTEWAAGFVQNEIESMGVPCMRTTKGAVVATFEGLRNDKPRALTAHIDTLGAMVAEIKSNGRLRMTPLNGVMWPSVESEGVVVRTRRGAQVRGSIVLKNGAAHVNRDARTAPRDADNLEVRLDERTTSREETRLLGIDVGDYVAFDPRFEAGEAGFVRARFLDDKAAVACVMAAVKALTEAGVSPAQRTHLLFSNFEEVGHGGMDGLPEDLHEFLVVDMACVGEGQNGDEFHCSICTKDSSGPYSHDFSDQLRSIADRAGIELRPDVYPHYGSDGSAYWASGGKAKVALIGPGVDTSHGYERTHREALRDTALLIAEYLIEE
ncbi:MAG: M42 family metallopeptidase [Fimbriimonadaceae bacterium]|nr:M42 family metallopeptidase [Fimbriimonadaceae bacterium]QYK55816.1 MAG: M42 family metallopeptidase [Fimbriimonadaceae bacterium]